MEYMACARPVIVSDASGHKDIVSEGNALLLRRLKDLQVNDSRGTCIGRWKEPSLDEVVSKLEYAYHNRNALNSLGLQAAEDMKRYTWRHCAEKLAGILRIG
jgi:glycosyltransferase involved in cell wall biosynthesis